MCVPPFFLNSVKDIIDGRGRVKIEGFPNVFHDSSNPFYSNDSLVALKVQTSKLYRSGFGIHRNGLTCLIRLKLLEIVPLRGSIYRPQEKLLFLESSFCNY